MDEKPSMSDFPKLHCPFIRQTYEVDRKQFKKLGRKLKLRNPEVYLVVDRVNPGYEWVFEDPDTFAVEKLDGTNVKLLTEGGRLVARQNRLNVIDPLQIMKGKTFIVEGIFMAIGKGYVKEDGEQSGESAAQPGSTQWMSGISVLGVHARQLSATRAAKA